MLTSYRYRRDPKRIEYRYRVHALPENDPLINGTIFQVCFCRTRTLSEFESFFSSISFT